MLEEKMENNHFLYIVSVASKQVDNCAIAAANYKIVRDVFDLH